MVNGYGVDRQDVKEETCNMVQVQASQTRHRDHYDWKLTSVATDMAWDHSA